MIVLSAAQVAGGLAGAAVSLVTLLGLLWRIMTAIVRHIEATHANTKAISTLGDALAEHVTKTSDRLTAVESTTKQHALILERLPRHA